MKVVFSHPEGLFTQPNAIKSLNNVAAWIPLYRLLRIHRNDTQLDALIKQVAVVCKPRSVDRNDTQSPFIFTISEHEYDGDSKRLPRILKDMANDLALVIKYVLSEHEPRNGSTAALIPVRKKPRPYVTVIFSQHQASEIKVSVS